MSFLNKLLASSIGRAMANRDVEARQQNSGGGNRRRNALSGDGAKKERPAANGPSFAEVIRARGGLFAGGPKGVPAPSVGGMGYSDKIRQAVANPQSMAPRIQGMGAPIQEPAPRPEVTGVQMANFGGMPMPVPQFSQAGGPNPQIEYLSRLVAQGLYPDLQTAAQAEAQRQQQGQTMSSGIAAMLPRVAGSLFRGS